MLSSIESQYNTHCLSLVFYFGARGDAPPIKHQPNVNIVPDPVGVDCMKRKRNQMSNKFHVDTNTEGAENITHVNSKHILKSLKMD